MSDQNIMRRDAPRGPPQQWFSPQMQQSMYQPNAPQTMPSQTMPSQTMPAQTMPSQTMLQQAQRFQAQAQAQALPTRVSVALAPDSNPNFNSNGIYQTVINNFRMLGGGRGTTVAEMTREMVERTCASDWLIRLCGRAGARKPGQSVQMLYGDGYVTTVGLETSKFKLEDSFTISIGLSVATDPKQDQAAIDTLPILSPTDFVLDHVSMPAGPGAAARLLVRTSGVAWVDFNGQLDDGLERNRTLVVWPRPGEEYVVGRMQYVPHAGAPLPKTKKKGKSAPVQKEESKKAAAAAALATIAAATATAPKPEAVAPKSPSKMKHKTEAKKPEGSGTTPTPKSPGKKRSKKTAESEEESAGEPEVAAAASEKPSKKKKKDKDPNKPKRNVSAFMLFSVANRGRIKQKNADKSFGDVARMVAAEFNSLPEKDRKKWDKKAEADKARYVEEMKIYKAKSV